MKAHPIPSILSIAAVIVAALVVAVAFGVSTGSPAAQAQTTPVDYDTDDDGLIEISNRAQLDAVRYDLSGSGTSTNSLYVEAFRTPADGMGCPDSDSDNNPGPCKGYELGRGDELVAITIDLSGKNWTPIGGDTASTLVFEGNNFTISNMTIDLDALPTGNDVGLFVKADGEIRNLKLTNVSVTVDEITVTTSFSVGALVGYGGMTVTNVHVTGRVSVDRSGSGNTLVGGLVGGIGTNGSVASSSAAVVVTLAGTGSSDAGGLVGGNHDTIRASYATGAVTVTSGAPARAGGLVGDQTNASATIIASYATGDVSATASTGDAAADAGGLVGNALGSITASYSTGNATAKATGTATARAGGLVGGGGTIVTSYSTGAPTATADTGGTAIKSGLSDPNAIVTLSYWDTDTSGMPDVTTLTGARGLTTAKLQQPTSYGTGPEIYSAWKRDIDGVGGDEDPWRFGGSWQYPVLQYGVLDPENQRPRVTLALSATTTSENGGTVTLTATQNMESKLDTVVKLTATAGATLSADTLTIAAGSTSGSVTVTAVDNSTLAANPDVTISGAVQAGGSGANNPADVTLAITDDETDAPIVVENVKVTTKETLAVVTWDALTGATGYTVEWTGNVTRGAANWARFGSMTTDRTSATIRRLVPGSDYAFRVRATNLDDSASAQVMATTQGEDDGASPFPTYTPTPTPTPVATPIPPTTQVGTSTAVTLTSSDGTMTIDIPAGSRSAPYQVNFETQAGCDYAGSKADVTFTCVTFKIFDSDDMLETDVAFDAAPTVSFTLTAEQVENLGGEFLMAKLHEMGGLMIVTRASAGGEWTAVDTTLTMDDDTGGATLSAMPSGLTTITAAAIQATYDAVQAEYGHLLPRDTLTPPTGGPSVPAAALLALLLGATALLATGWVLTARRNGA